MIQILDLQYLDLPRVIASFLIETDAGPVLVETGPHATFSNLQAGVQAAGYELSDIQHVFVTHIHLDHAGAAWALARQGATVYVHPFGERHMVDTAKLYASAKRIYGDDMERMWGDLQPIPQRQLKVADNGDKIRLGEKTFVAWHTPGHAIHHIAWQLEDVLFTGDVAGVLIENVMVQPPCPPPDINLELWDHSIALIRSLNVEKMYLTHFGVVENIDAHLSELQQRYREWAEWIRPRWAAGQSPEEITPEFQKFANQQLIEAGATEAQLAQYDAANPAWMSVAGLLRYWSKRAEKR